jgi:hypothetical protein
MRIHPENFHIGTLVELKALSRLRYISVEGLQLASEAVFCALAIAAATRVGLCSIKRSS